jgi:hypothetical protein
MESDNNNVASLNAVWVTASLAALFTRFWWNEIWAKLRGKPPPEQSEDSPAVDASNV